MIRVTLEEQSKEITYPCLMENTTSSGRIIVLALSKRCGVVLVADVGRDEMVGERSDDFVEFTDCEIWQPYKGTVKIKSE